MSFTAYVNHDEMFLYVIGLGDLTGQDVDDYFNILKNTEDVTLCEKGLLDLSDPGVSVKHIPISSIKSLGLAFKSSPILPSGTKMAVVVRITGLRLCEAIYGYRGDGVETRPFKRMHEALAWLDLPESAIPKVNVD
ncbi:MAG: hypothetical protein R8M14_03320 [Ghiorsea sp.]